MSLLCTSASWPSGRELDPADALGIPWLDVLTPDQRSWACDEIRVSTFRSKAPVFRQGGLNPGWVGVLEGLVRIGSCDESGCTTTIAGFLPGSWFGEGTVLKREPCRYFADALRASRLAMLPSESFHILLEQSLAFNRFVLNQINERLSMFIAAREWERIKEPHRRLARQLFQLCGPTAGQRDGIVLHMKQQELAELTGLSRQCVNGAIAQLARCGMVHAQYGSLAVLDVPALLRT